MYEYGIWRKVACCFKQDNGSTSVYIEVFEYVVFGIIMRGLCGRVNDCVERAVLIEYIGYLFNGANITGYFSLFTRSVKELMALISIDADDIPPFL